MASEAGGGMSTAAKTGWVLAVACISALIVNANTSAVTILIPSISEDTGSPTSFLQWAVTGYSLVGAAVIVTSGALGDVFGRRKLFVGGLLLFIASCAFIALSQGGLGVVVGRAIQGASGATILACGMSLLSVSSSGPDQIRALSMWGAASAVGAAIGPLFAGLLVDSPLGWQGLFWIDAVIAALCVPATLVYVGESRDPARSRSIDWAGTVLIAVILAPVILAFTEGSDWGWASPKTLACFGVSIAATIAFLRVERRVAAPLVNLDLLRNRLLVGATLAILFAAGAINALMYILSLFFQDPDGLGMSALGAGAATLPAAAGIIVISAAVAKLSERMGGRSVIMLGFAIMTAGFGGMALTSSSWGYWMFVLPLIAVAVGMGLANGPASSISTSSVPQDEVGAASGISNMARYVGAAVWTAAVAAIYATTIAGKTADGVNKPDALAAAVRRSSLALAVISGIGIALAILNSKRRARKAQAIDFAASAASSTHTLPIAASGEPVTT